MVKRAHLPIILLKGGAISLIETNTLLFAFRKSAPSAHISYPRPFIPAICRLLNKAVCLELGNKRGHIVDLDTRLHPVRVEHVSNAAYRTGKGPYFRSHLLIRARLRMVKMASTIKTRFENPSYHSPHKLLKYSSTNPPYTHTHLSAHKYTPCG